MSVGQELVAARPDAALDARDVVKTFRDGERTTEVLKGLDLWMNRGEFVALTGASGSGKSTLLSILGTLLRPTSGSVVIAGQEVTHLSAGELDRFRNYHLGFVFQFHHLLPDFNALENVLFPAYARYGRARRQERDRARDLLTRVGLETRLDYRPSQLSGGQKQRVAVARALMMGPDVVLADEPTGNLDRETTESVLELLLELGRDEDIAFLLSTHDEDVAARCHRHVHLVDGLASES